MKSYTPKVREILLANNCYWVRNGNGDHQIWHSPITNINFTFDQCIKSRHTANEVLKQAGIPKQF